MQRLDPRDIHTPFAEDLIRVVLDPDGARLIAINGGVGTGKSYTIAQVMFVVAVTRPGAAVLVTQRTLGDLEQILKKRCDEVFGRLKGVRWVGASTWKRYEFANGPDPKSPWIGGSTITFKEYQLHGTQDEASNSIEGRDYHLLISDETGQLPAPFFQHSVERCRLPWNDLNGVTFEPTVIWVGRPGAVDHWIREVDDRTRKGAKGRTMFPRTHDNPVFWIRGADGRLVNPYLDGMRAGLSPAVFVCRTQEVPGAQMPIKGAIYGDWSEDPWPRGNVLHGFEPDLEAPIYLAADFGGTTDSYLWVQPAVIDGVLLDVVFDEWHPSEWTSVTEAVRGIRRRGWPVAEMVCDPAGKQRSKLTAQEGLNIIGVFQRGPEDDPDGLGGGLGVPVIYDTASAKMPVKSGVFKVQARVLSAEGVRALVCTAELWEGGRQAKAGARTFRHMVLSYAWGPDGEPLKGARGHHADHCADALRYYVRRYRWGGVEPEPLAWVPQASAGGGSPLLEVFSRGR